MNTIARYVPHHEAQKYRDEGWTIEPLIGNHGAYSVLATMPEWQHIGDVTKRIIKQAEERYYMDHYSQGFEAWMQTARAGDRFIYFRGVTPEIRPDSFKMAYKAERAGYVSLTQRKCHAVKETSYGPVYEYEYLAEKV